MAGPRGDMPILALGLVLLLGLSALWFATVGRWVATHVYAGGALVGCAALLLAVNFWLYIACAFCDPGTGVHVPHRMGDRAPCAAA